MEVLLVLGAVVAAMLIGVPVAFAFALGGFALIWIFELDPGFAIPAAIRAIDSFTLLSLPLFILAGALMREADISRRLVAFSAVLVGRIRGGLGVVTIFSCAIFGAISGSASAAISSIGSILIPEMQRHGYTRGYATGLVAVSSLLSLLIPPSIPMIVFAMAAQLSILQAFLSTLVPAILMALAYCVINLVMCRGMKTDARIGAMRPKQRVVELWRVTREAAFALLMPVLVLGGIYGGVFTPTEAAGMGCLFAVLTGFLFHRTMKLRGLAHGVWTSMMTSGVIVVLLFFIMLLSRVLVFDQVPQQLTETLLSISQKKWAVLLMINVTLLVMGMLVDDISGNILSAALLLPVATSVGVDPVHFAAISVTNLSLGNLTPPVAPMLYLAGTIGGRVPITEYIRPSMIFLLVGALPIVLLVTFVPPLSLALVSLVR